VAVAYKHVQEQPLPPSRINSNVPSSLEAIDMKLLNKDPVLRYPSSEDLRSDLRRFLEGQPVSATGLAGAAAGATIAAGVASDATTAVPTTMIAGGGPLGPNTTALPQATPPDKNRTGLYVGLLVGLLVVIGGILLFVGSNMGKSTAQVEVPDVTGQNVVDATNNLRNQGFKVTVKNQTNDTVPLNQVFEQNPKGNTKADSGAAIEIVVSGGIGDAKVPDVVGRTQAAAESLLKTSGFIPEVKEASSDTVAKGTVISQSPSANGKATKNSVVTITVSSGAGDVSIPNVVGLTASTASNQLGQAGFTVTTTSQSSSTTPSGSVISTNPTAGTKAAKGSAVAIVVSTGPPATTTTTTTASTTTTS
jgi:serine/threonine-protein kinase